MKALVLEDELLLKELPRPVPGQGDALLRVRMAGICNTDLEIVKGYMGFKGVLGHEFVGEVVEAGQADWVGERVCGEINFGCGGCDYCARGLSRHCPNRTVLGILNQNGAFAEFVVVPVSNLRRVPDGVSDQQAVFVEPLAAAFEILEQVQIQPAWRVAVVGDGKLGLLIGQVLRLTACDLVLVGKHERKLQLARSLGVAACALSELPANAFEVVVEVSGSASGFESALRLLKPRGTLVLKSTYHGHLELDAAKLVIDEITVVGSRCGRFEPAIRALTQKAVRVEELVDAVYPFEQAAQAFSHARQPGSLKILLDFHA